MTLDLHKRSDGQPLTHEDVDENWDDIETSLITPHVGMYGDIGGANASPAIQAMIDDVGFFRLPAGIFNCQDPLILPSHAELGGIGIDTVSSGQGRDRSRLVADDMTGSSFIKTNGSGIFRMAMRDFCATGECDTAIDFMDVSLFGSLFENLTLRSVAGPAFAANEQFSTTHLRCHFNSVDNHSIFLGGGNTTLLMNCYAHVCGAGMAGYRIEGHATLIECNGLDAPPGENYWGWFGKEATSLYQIAIIGGNAEDFRTAAIALEYDGQIDINNFAMLAPPTGTFETYIKIINGNAHRIRIRGNTRVLTKGATRSGNSNIEGAGCQPLVENNSSNDVGSFPDFYNTSNSLLYNVPNLQVRGGTLGRLDLQITSSHSLRESGYLKPTLTSMTANVTTFSVASLNAVKTQNSIATGLAAFTGGEEGQELLLIIGDANTTVRHNIGGANRLILKSAADETPASGAVYKFVFAASVWRQI